MILVQGSKVKKNYPTSQFLGKFKSDIFQDKKFIVHLTVSGLVLVTVKHCTGHSDESTDLLTRVHSRFEFQIGHSHLISNLDFFHLNFIFTTPTTSDFYCIFSVNFYLYENYFSLVVNKLGEQLLI